MNKGIGGSNNTVVVQNLGYDRNLTHRLANCANAVQGAARFEVRREISKQSTEPFLLDDGNYDLDAWINENLAEVDSHRPLVVLTNLGYGSPNDVNHPDGYYFADTNIEVDGVATEICIISTKPWDVRFPDKKEGSDYLMLMLSTWLLGHEDVGAQELEFHKDTRGCLFDYCDVLDDIVALFDAKYRPSAPFCDDCWRLIETGLKRGYYTIAQIASAIRLYRAAVGERSAFVAIPFDGLHDMVFEVVGELYGSRGFKVFRADQFPFVRDIRKRMELLISCSDTVIGDVSVANPNVMFELGVADALGIDTVVLSSKKPLPFDIGFHHTVFYDSLEQLKAELS